MRKKSNRDTLPSRELQKMLKLIRDLSGFDCSVLDEAGNKLAETPVAPPICKLMKSSKVGSKLCKDCWKSSARRPNNDDVQVSYCDAQMASVQAPLRFGSHFFGYLVCGGERDKAKKKVAAAEAQLGKLARPVDIPAEELIEAYRQSPAISAALLRKRQTTAKRQAAALSEMVGNAWFMRVVGRIYSCPRRGGFGKFWATVAEAVGLLVPTKRVEIVAVAPAEDSFAQVWPEKKSPPRAPTRDNIEAMKKCGFARISDRELLLAVQSGDRLLAMIRVQQPTGGKGYTDVDVTQFVKLARAVGEKLATLRAHAVKEALAALQPRLARAKDHYERLRLLLQRCMALLDCAAGDVALAGEGSTDWLKVVARHGRGVDSLPRFLSGDVGITGRVMRTKSPAVVPRTSDDPDFRGATSDEGTLRHRYRREHWQKYREFLHKTRACVRLPLMVDDDMLGVLCLRRQQEGSFDLDTVHVVEALTSRAAIEAACILSIEESSNRSLLPKESAGSPERLAARFIHLTPADARTELCRELAKVAMDISGAFRTAVRMKSPDGTSLGVIALHAREPGSWPDDSDEQLFGLDEDCAATYAFNRGKSYFIEDTWQKDVHFRAIEPEPASHASIVLEAGTQKLGILNVDWKEPRAFTRSMIQVLQGLSDRYARAIKLYDVDELFRDLETNLKERSGERTKPDYQQFLETVAKMVGTDQGSIFIRQPDTGRYHLAACLADPKVCDGNHWYELGEGVTGWVAEKNRPVRISDLSKEAELATIAPDLAWKNKFADGRQNMRNLSYLGVPIAAGREVIGVMRLATARRGDFSGNDLQIALAAASRLAGVLKERDESLRTNALMQLASRVATVTSQKKLAAEIFRALRFGVGDCACHIRLLDKVHLSSGEAVGVLTRLAASDEEWNSTPRCRARNQGIAGQVWEAREAVVYQDVREEATRKAMADDVPTKSLLKKVGSGACFPIETENKFIGTLHVHKRYRRALSPRDIEFIEEVAHFAAPALEKAGRAEEDALQIHLETAIDEFLMNLLSGRSGREEESKLFSATLKALRLNFATKAAWVRMPNRAGTRFEVIESWGISLADVPAFAVDDVVKAIAAHGFLVVSDSEADVPMIRQAKEKNPRYGEIVERTHGCMIGMMLGDQPLATFSILVQRVDQINYRRIEHAMKMLQRLAELIRLGRDFERQKRDGEVTLPLALLGSLLSGYEHQLFGPLSRLKLAIEFMADGPRTPELAAKKLGRMEEDRELLEECLKRLRDFVGQWERQFEDVDMAKILRAAAHSVEAAKTKATVKLDFPSDRVTVRGNPEHLDNAFQLLIQNALQAVEGKGAEGCVTVRVAVPSGDRCVIVIEDNGPGMSEEVRKRAFELFFTTKTKGTGTGLPAAYCILRCHQGDLQIESNGEGGTRIVVSLPVEKGNS